jgi:hypothetical protein
VTRQHCRSSFLEAALNSTSNGTSPSRRLEKCYVVVLGVGTSLVRLLACFISTSFVFRLANEPQLLVSTDFRTGTEENKQ